MSRILLTGTSGLVGGHLAAALSAGHEVFALGRQRSHPVAGVTPIGVDLSSEWSIDALPSRIDAVVHLAQSNRWQDFPDGAPEMFAVNVASTARLLDYALRAGATRFVLASTGGLYGSVDGAITEGSPIGIPAGPLQYYFETKRAAEGLAQAYRDRLAVSVLRPFFIYGAGQRQPKLIPRLIDRIRAGEIIRLRGEDGSHLNPTHVDDVVAVIATCLSQQHHGIVNLGGGQVTTIRAMSTRIAGLLGVPVRFESATGAAECFVADVALMRTLIQRAPIGFDDGIASFLAGDGRR